MGFSSLSLSLSSFQRNKIPAKRDNKKDYKKAQPRQVAVITKTTYTVDTIKSITLP
jgi:hypothetical protein